MAFAICGKNGNRFQNNVWWWRPLWGYTACTCVDILTKEEMESGRFNDGTWIPEPKAVEIGKRLLSMIDSGDTARYAEERLAYMESLPDELCDFCKGTGYRSDHNHTCTRCEGTGMARPWQTNYPFDVENVRTFAEFCLSSGGFEIW